MRYDATQPIGITDISFQNPNIPKPHGINLDLRCVMVMVCLVPLSKTNDSSRKKIVIRPFAGRKESVLSRPAVSMQSLVLNSSIFNRALSKLPETVDDPEMDQLQGPSKAESTMRSSSQCIDLLVLPMTGEKSDIAHPEAMTLQLDKQLIEEDSATTTSTRDIVPSEAVPLLYSQEYTTCRCGIDTKRVCSKCQFLQLTERQVMNHNSL